MYLDHMLRTLDTMVARFRLRELLEDAGISQSNFARQAGLSFATINRLCTNATGQVSLETLDKIVTALEAAGVRVGIGDLIERLPERRGRRK